MGDTSLLFSRDDLQKQSEKIERSFLWANTAVAFVLLCVLGLGLAAVLAGSWASSNQRRAEVAEQHAREKDGFSLLAQAHASRLAGLRGHRLQSLKAIQLSTSILPSIPLREEAIAALTSLDLEVEGQIYPCELPFRHTYQFGLKRYAISASNGGIGVYRATDHVEEWRLTREALGFNDTTRLTSLDFNKDGRYLSAKFSEGEVVIWDLRTGEAVAVHSAPPGFQIGNTTWIDNEKLFVAERLKEQSRFSWITMDGSPSRTQLFQARINGASPRPKSDHIAVSMGQEVQIWDLNQPAPTNTFINPGPVGPATWSSDGNRFAVATNDGDVYLWNVANGRFQPMLGHTELIRLMVFSPDDAMLMTTSWDNTTRLWDVQTGRPILICEGELGSAFSEDCERIGFARPGEGIGVWRFQRNTLLRTLQPVSNKSSKILHFDLSPDGQWLAALVHGNVHLWDLSQINSGRTELLGDVETLSFHPKEPLLLLCRSGGLEWRKIVMDGSDGLPRLGPAEPVDLPAGVEPRQATLSLDGHTLLVEMQDLSFWIIDFRGQRPPVLLEGKQWWRNELPPASGTGSGRMAISPDGLWAAVGYSVGPKEQEKQSQSWQWAGVWDARTGRRVFTPDHLGGVLFSPDKKRLLMRSEAAVYAYSTGKWFLERKLPLENLATQIGSIAVTEKSSWVAVSRSRQSVELFDSETYKEMAALVPPMLHSVTNLRCALDGSRLAVGTASDQILVWNMESLWAELAALGLDWESQDRQPSGASVSSNTLFFDLQAGFMFLGSTAAAIAVFISLLVLRWHRNLIKRFVRMEATVEKRQSQLEYAKLELLHSNKMKALGTLAAGIAHDFNNLLSVIRVSNQLSGRAKTEPERAEYREAVELAVVQGKTVVSSMLGYSREGTPEHEICDVTALVKQTVQLLRQEFLGGIDLNLELDTTIPPVLLNRSKFHQAILNLLVNAAEAMKQSGRLVVSIRAVQNLPEIPDGRFSVRPRPANFYVQILVLDSGPGISPEIMDRIFEPFFTTKTAGVQKGTGLGLSVVHNIASQEGLGLAVVSREGEGAAFYFFLPVDGSSGEIQSKDPCQN